MDKLTEGERLVISPQYLAGAIDADGCIGVAKMAQTIRGKSLRYDARLQLTNTNLPFLEAVQEQYGGHIKTASRGISANPKWKTGYHLCWGTKGSELVIRQILPYLIIKKERAELALELRSTMGHYVGQGAKLPQDLMEKREGIFVEMKRLNLKGIPV